MGRRIAFLLLAFVLATVGMSPVLAASGTLGINSAWGGANLVADSWEVVTYGIKAGKGVPTEAVTAVQAGIDTWNSSINGQERVWAFDLVPFVSTGKGSKADIEIQLKAGGGLIAGLARWSYDANGFIIKVSIQISGSSFGLKNDAETVKQITMHELGHGLGLGHHSNENDLMGETVGYEGGGPSACDLNGFVFAHNWLVTGSTPYLPTDKSITCN